MSSEPRKFPTTASTPSTSRRKTTLSDSKNSSVPTRKSPTKKRIPKKISLYTSPKGIKLEKYAGETWPKCLGLIDFPRNLDNAKRQLYGPSTRQIWVYSYHALRILSEADVQMRKEATERIATLQTIRDSLAKMTQELNAKYSATTTNVQLLSQSLNSHPTPPSAPTSEAKAVPNRPPTPNQSLTSAEDSSGTSDDIPPPPRKTSNGKTPEMEPATFVFNYEEPDKSPIPKSIQLPYPPKRALDSNTASPDPNHSAMQPWQAPTHLVTQATIVWLQELSAFLKKLQEFKMQGVSVEQPDPVYLVSEMVKSILDIIWLESDIKIPDSDYLWPLQNPTQSGKTKAIFDQCMQNLLLPEFIADYSNDITYLITEIHSLASVVPPPLSTLVLQLRQIVDDIRKIIFLNQQSPGPAGWEQVLKHLTTVQNESGFIETILQNWTPSQQIRLVLDHLSETSCQGNPSSPASNPEYSRINDGLVLFRSVFADIYTSSRLYGSHLFATEPDEAASTATNNMLKNIEKEFPGHFPNLPTDELERNKYLLDHVRNTWQRVINQRETFVETLRGCFRIQFSQSVPLLLQGLKHDMLMIEKEIGAAPILALQIVKRLGVTFQAFQMDFFSNSSILPPVRAKSLSPSVESIPHDEMTEEIGGESQKELPVKKEDTQNPSSSPTRQPSAASAAYMEESDSSSEATPTKNAQEAAPKSNNTPPPTQKASTPTPANPPPAAHAPSHAHQKSTFIGSIKKLFKKKSEPALPASKR